jgi:hypothetical protein
MQTAPDTELQAKENDGYMCPRCHDRIPDQFYCRGCGYVPNWRQMACDEYEPRRKAA